MGNLLISFLEISEKFNINLMSVYENRRGLAKLNDCRGKELAWLMYSRQAANDYFHCRLICNYFLNSQIN